MKKIATLLIFTILCIGCQDDQEILDIQSERERVERSTEICDCEYTIIGPDYKKGDTSDIVRELGVKPCNFDIYKELKGEESFIKTPLSYDCIWQ